VGEYYLNASPLDGGDFAIAKQWFEKAAALNEPASQTLLGSRFAETPEERVKWYQSAAQLDYPPAQHLLGQCYANGNGVNQDTELAKYWIGKAAALGYAPAVDAWKNFQ
ncbi:MAG: tetratricopeptide repeat protein, partial [Thermoguttaceae bacterium]